MKKFTLICEDGSEYNTQKFQSDYLHVALEKIELFLKSSGFEFEGILKVGDTETKSDPFDNQFTYDLSNISLEEIDVPFSGIVHDHLNMLEKYDDVMNIDLTQPKAGGCVNCTCGKNNAN